jgi:hypothetical protein
MDSSAPKSSVLPLTIALVLVISGSLFYYLKASYPFLFKTITTRVTSMIPTKEPPIDYSNLPVLTPTPIPYTLPKGAQKYTFNHGSEVKGPKPVSVTIDPLDPKSGATQTITVDLVSDSPVTSSSLTIITDNNQKDITLEKITGDELKGTYQGSWQVDDSYENRYSFRFLLKSNTGTYDNTMYMRR